MAGLETITKTILEEAGASVAAFSRFEVGQS